MNYTLEQIQKRFSWLDKSGWTQHKSGGWIYKDATVSEKVETMRGIAVCGVIWNGEIYGGVIHGGVIRGGVIRESPIFIQGAKHFLTQVEKGKIQIGCHDHTYEYWLENYVSIGARERYTHNQVREYKKHIDHVISLGGNKYV